MKRKLGVSSFSLGVVTFCLFLGQGLWGQSTNVVPPGANTGCGYSLASPTVPVRPEPRPRQNETEARSPRLVLVADHHSGSDASTASIVGLWKIQFVLPDGTVLDDGYSTWHSDGTELMNSGLRPPMTGSFCMGTWKQTSSGSYKLNHFAVSWDSTGTTLVGPANIREVITVAPSGKIYNGSFTLDQYDTNGNLIVHFAGSVTGQRITAD
jgi:hypothetical protein